MRGSKMTLGGDQRLFCLALVHFCDCLGTIEVTIEVTPFTLGW